MLQSWVKDSWNPSKTILDPFSRQVRVRAAILNWLSYLKKYILDYSFNNKVSQVKIERIACFNFHVIKFYSLYLGRVNNGSASQVGTYPVNNLFTNFHSSHAFLSNEPPTPCSKLDFVITLFFSQISR